MARNALVQSQLEVFVADAPPLPAPVIDLLMPQFLADPDSPLPSCADLCAQLGIPADRSAAAGSTTPLPAARLPMRVISGQASPLERTLWRTYSDGAIHELLSRELVAALAAHIRNMLSGQPANGQRDTLPTVLEIGAGSGGLALRLAAQLSGVVRYIAVDDASSGIGMQTNVERCDCVKALAVHEPAVVVVSWCPSGVDFSHACRMCPSVIAYVMLGESDSSTCGDSWATWGALPDDPEAYGMNEATTKPYQADGFARTELTAIGRWLISRFDSAAARGFSSAVGFSRTKSSAM